MPAYGYERDYLTQAAADARYAQSGGWERFRKRGSGGQLGKRYYAATVMAQQGYTNAAATINTLSATPFLSGAGGTLTDLALNVTTIGAAGSVMRVGIYTNSSTDGDLYPDQLLVDGGEKITDSGTGYKATTGLSIALAPNRLYWAVSLSGVAQPTVTVLQNANPVGLIGYPSSVFSTAQFSLQVAQTYGALPTTFPVGAVLSGSLPPAVFFSLD